MLRTHTLPVELLRRGKNRVRLFLTPPVEALEQVVPVLARTQPYRLVIIHGVDLRLKK